MPLPDIFLPLAVIFTVLCGLLIVLILGLHLRENLRIRHAASFRKSAEPILQRYLAGSIPLAEVMAVLETKPQDGLQLLIEHSEVHEPVEAERLQAAFKSFHCTHSILMGLMSHNWETRLSNAQLLGYLRDNSVILSLLKTLNDEVIDVRLAAAQSLAMLGYVEATRPILRALDVPTKMPPGRVVEVLVELGTHDRVPLLAILNDPETSDGALAITVQTIGILRANQAVPRLIEVLQSKSDEIRINAAHALALIEDSKGIIPISRLVDDPILEVRSQAMLSLGALHAKDQLPLLIKSLNDPKWEVRFSAAQALYLVGEPGRQALKKAANDHIDQLAYDISRQILQDHSESLPVAKARS